MLEELYEYTNEHEIEEEYVGRSIMTVYNNRVYTIDEIDFTKNPDNTFHHARYKEISYADYLMKEYKYKVRDHKQPLVKNINKRTNNTIYLVPECCVRTGITEQ